MRRLLSQSRAVSAIVAAGGCKTCVDPIGKCNSNHKMITAAATESHSIRRFTTFTPTAAVAGLMSSPASSAPPVVTTAFPPLSTAMVEPRVLAWYRADSRFDMTRVVKVLEESGVRIEVCYPPCPSLSSSSSSAAAATAAATAGRSVVAAHQLEFVGFTVASARSTSSTVGALLPRTTYMVFADGGIVAWNADWEELVLMRSFLTADSATSATSSLSTKPQGIASLKEHISASVTAAYPSASTIMASQTGSSGSSKSLAFDSLRYVLFDTMPMDQRPTDDDPHHGSSAAFIDAARDRIVLRDDSSVLEKVPFSYALVQSVKLEALHHAIEPIALDVKRWQQRLSVDGRLVVSLSSLRKAKAQLLSLTESVHFEQEATPKLFWHAEFGSLRSSYRDVNVHLEMEERLGGFKQQLEAVDETLSYLHQEVHAAMNEWLTWVIIVLIAAELLVASGAVERLLFGSGGSSRHQRRKETKEEAGQPALTVKD